MVTDDIVTRLREPCSWVESTHTRFGLDQERAEAADEIEQLRRDVDSQDSVAYRNLDRLYRDQKRELNDVRFVVLELLRSLYEMQELSMLPKITERFDNALLAVEELVKYEKGENDG